MVGRRVTGLAVGALWAGVGQAASGSGSAGPRVVTAEWFATVAGPDPRVFGTSLEGAAFDSHGHFYFVDTTAPARQPKLLSLDLKTRKTTGLYTDDVSMLNCIGFAPDGTMYLCDLKNGDGGGGRVVSYDPASGKIGDVLTNVGGAAFVPDDMAIAGNGDMYIADYQGTPTSRTGNIILREANGQAGVALPGLAHPNGIVLAADQSGLWIDQDLSGTLDHVAKQYSSPASTDVTVTLHTASYLSLGSNAYTDSLTVDGKGNIYMAVYGASEVLEFDPSGVQIGRVAIPGDAPNVTHVAIEPGTDRAFVTASGPGGGYIYTFPALAPAPADTANGG
ncbi:MAG TPA: SMP-30/gluconolactonase/LRE family protein [Actinospica sp.]|jgi:lactonase|nr:SMP-30/gluconolactonase/LRE family protein [Actinospica sp.]